MSVQSESGSHPLRPKFLVVDANRERGRDTAQHIEYPFERVGGGRMSDATVHLTQSTEHAAELLAQDPSYTALVVHSAETNKERGTHLSAPDPDAANGLALVDRIRRRDTYQPIPNNDPDLPIIIVDDEKGARRPNLKEFRGTPTQIVSVNSPDWQQQVAGACKAHVEAKAMNPTQATITARPPEQSVQVGG